MSEYPLLKWLLPGIRLKRWIFLAVTGLALAWFSARTIYLESNPLAGFLLFGIALFFFATGTVIFIRNLLDFLYPRASKDRFDSAFRHHHLKKGLKIVVLGGGTGLSTLLQGLKAHSSNLTAIVTVTDEGGSSGRLRKDYNLLPPGDIRQCLASLSDAPPLMADLFQYRFDGDSDLSQHSFGNLFILAMTKVTGDFELALKESSKILAIRGQVLPSALTDVRLVAETENGNLLKGELEISDNKLPIKRLMLDPAKVKPSKESLKALEEADAIILGPGSLYTSIIPNILVDEIRQAIEASPAYKIYVCNVMTQHGETERFTLSDHVDKIVSHSSGKIMDCVIANMNMSAIPDSLLKKYKQENADPVKIDREKIERMGYRFIGGDIISFDHFVRHDPQKLADLIITAIHSRDFSSPGLFAH